MNVPSPQLARMSASFIGAAVLLVALTGCHTSSRPKRDPHQPLTFNERTAQKKGDMNKVSGFDKMLSSAALGDRGAMKVMGRKSFGAGDYKGNTTYTGSKDYQTKDFAGAGMTNRAQSQFSPMGSKKNTSADKTFATSDSRWAGKSAQGSEKVYGGSKQEYKTSAYGPGMKSLEKDKRPYFMPATDLDKTKSYAEEDVKALLNRN